MKKSTAIPILIGLAAGIAFYVGFVLIFLNLILKRFVEDYPVGEFACRVMSDPINCFSITAFTIALTLLIYRSARVRSEEKVFENGVLAHIGSEEAYLLPTDAQNLRRDLKQLDQGTRESTLMRLFFAGLQRARANWSAEDASNAVHRQAEIIEIETESEYGLIKYLAWAIPSIGFIGTVLGIGQAMGAFRDTGDAEGSRMEIAAGYLNTAFDTTLVALVLSLILMFFVHRVQASEEAVLSRAMDECLHRFVIRMHME